MKGIKNDLDKYPGYSEACFSSFLAQDGPFNFPKVGEFYYMNKGEIQDMEDYLKKYKIFIEDFVFEELKNENEDYSNFIKIKIDSDRLDESRDFLKRARDFLEVDFILNLDSNIKNDTNNQRSYRQDLELEIKRIISAQNGNDNYLDPFILKTFFANHDFYLPKLDFYFGKESINNLLHEILIDNGLSNLVNYENDGLLLINNPDFNNFKKRFTRVINEISSNYNLDINEKIKEKTNVKNDILGGDAHLLHMEKVVRPYYEYNIELVEKKFREVMISLYRKDGSIYDLVNILSNSELDEQAQKKCLEISRFNPQGVHSDKFEYILKLSNLKK